MVTATSLQPLMGSISKWIRQYFNVLLDWFGETAPGVAEELHHTIQSQAGEQMEHGGLPSTPDSR